MGLETGAGLVRRRHPTPDEKGQLFEAAEGGS